MIVSTTLIRGDLILKKCLIVHKDDLSKDQLKGAFVFSFVLCYPIVMSSSELLYAEVMSFVPSI